MKNFSLFILIFSLNFLTSLAGTLTPSEKSKVAIELPYSMGTHEFSAKAFSGKIEWDEKANEIKSGELKLAIEAIKVKKSELKCHMMEALGLDYKASKFPKSHVCNNDDELPKDGPDSIKYPEITGTLLSPLKMGENEAKVSWQIHGKIKEMTMPVTLTKGEGGELVVLNSKWKLKLSDFDIIVKKFLFIAVKDDVSLNMTLSLR